MLTCILNNILLGWGVKIHNLYCWKLDWWLQRYEKLLHQKLTQAQKEVFDVSTKYLQVLKTSATPLAVTKELEDYPEKACVVLDEVLSLVDEKATPDDLEKIKTRITFSMMDPTLWVTADKRKFRKVYNGVLEAFLAFIVYWEEKPSPRSYYSPVYTSNEDANEAER